MSLKGAALAVFHVFEKGAVVVSDLFVKIFGKSAAHNFALAAEQLLKTELGKVATVAVQKAQSLASGAEAHSAAFAEIAAAAVAAGIEAKDSLINMLIELAVQEVKGMFGTTAS